MSAISEDFDFENGSEEEPMVKTYHLWSYLAPLSIKLTFIMNSHCATNRSWQTTPRQLAQQVGENESVHYAGLKVIARANNKLFHPKGNPNAKVGLSRVAKKNAVHQPPRNVGELDDEMHNNSLDLHSDEKEVISDAEDNQFSERIC